MEVNSTNYSRRTWPSWPRPQKSILHRPNDTYLYRTSYFFVVLKTSKTTRDKPCTFEPEMTFLQVDKCKWMIEK